MCFLVAVFCGSCGSGFLVVLGGSCNVWWVFGPFGLKLVVVVGLLGGGHRRGWVGFGCDVLWWVQIGVKVARVVGFMAVLWWFCGGFWLQFVPWVFLFLIFILVVRG